MGPSDVFNGVPVYDRTVVYYVHFMVSLLKKIICLKQSNWLTVGGVEGSLNIREDPDPGAQLVS